MLTGLNHLHAYNRWLLVIVFLFVLVRAFTGWFGNKPYMKLDNAIGGTLVGLMHLQLIVGLALMFYYDWDLFINIVKDGSGKKILAIEHLTVGILAVALVQIGRIRSKKAIETVQKHKQMAIFGIIALILIVSRQPHWHF